MNLKLRKGDFDLAELFALFFSEALLDLRDASTQDKLTQTQAKLDLLRGDVGDVCSRERSTSIAMSQR